MKGSYVADLVTRRLEIELSPGDTIQIGDQFLTVVDIEGDEILFQLDSGDLAERISIQDLFSDSQSNS
ncbi:hypothetical protein Enr17x_22670 [Gimesia fumaroli]|uniref:Uncharacterized protein n=1 Tax=Gimesia fumaroli TaxID=2527976 RepID=A0A518IB17_9PLAN|nr:hypothetical protein Enr17x_22670 [Gimesia fumaroli]